MKYPLTSFTAALLIWLTIFALGDLVFYHQSPSIIHLDANLISEEKSPAEKLQPAKTIPEKSLKTAQQNPSNSQTTHNQIIPIYQPLPTIPDDLREEAFSSYAIARFHINIDGTATVELIKPCSNPKLNSLLLASLKKWHFAPANNSNILAPTTKDIRIEFKVE
jgi:protein TonB